MEESTTYGCCAPGCMLNIKIAKRHFFKFPRETERWLEWLKACDRMDLIAEGPEYAHRNCRLCHLHFRVELFRNIEGRIYLNKEAVPSIFLKPIQPGQNFSGSQYIQPVSFVTIFLKPESRSKHLESVTTAQSLVSQTLTESENKDTAIISPLQALFPRATIKQACDDSIIPPSQTTLLKDKFESNKENVPVEDAQPIKETTVNSEAPMTTLTRIIPKEKCVDATDIIDLTATDSLEPLPPPPLPLPPPPPPPPLTTKTSWSKSTSPRIPKRIRWHVCTQTPEAWLYIDAFLRKRPLENTAGNTSIAKRRKTFSSSSAEDYRTIADEFKAAYAELLPRNTYLMALSSIVARERRKKNSGRRTHEDRQFALELFFMAPSAYRFYRSLCLLPTVRQLWAHIRNWDISPGLNDNVLDALRLKMKSLPPIRRHCCLCAKEIQLRPHLFYNLSRDRIVGFHDTGAEKRRMLARKALVLVARGLADDWQQPIAYYFHGGACSPAVAKSLVCQAITKLRSIGLPVRALVTSTAPTFLRLSRQLKITAERPLFQVDDESVVFVFDVSRLIRATRNVLMKHDLQFHDKRASWADIEQFFKYDSKLRVPLSKLSLGHLEPSAQQRTETKYAAEVFSYRVASGLSAHFAAGRFPLRAIGTIELVHNFDRLYEFLNSSAPPDRNSKENTRSFCHAFSGTVHELSFLHRTLDFLRAIKAIGRNGACVKSIRCFDRWQMTINAIIELWDVLRSHQFPFLRTRRLTQEGIEHIFRSIRRQSGNRARPTPIVFTRAFKNLVSKHFLEHSNEDDSDVNTRRMLKRLTSSSSSVPEEENESAASAAAPSPITLSVPATNYREIDLRLPEERSPFKRVCEFLLNECVRVHAGCDMCAVAYGTKEGKDAFSLYVSGLEDTFMRNFEELSIEENLGARMLQLAQQVKYKPPCPNFPVAFLIKLFLRMRIYFTLSRHNKICKSAESRGPLDVSL